MEGAEGYFKKSIGGTWTDSISRAYGVEEDAWLSVSAVCSDVIRLVC
jgi:hypothetical protein